MALPILDGNQSLTSLSTVISGGSHIPAHTIVSFGSQAITDMASAISGSSVNVLTMPPISVTATVSGGLTDAQLRASPVTIGGSVTASISGTPSVTFGTAVITGSASILNFPATQTVTFTQIATHGVTIGAGTAQIGSVTASISGTVAVSGTFYQATQPVSIASLPSLAAGTNQVGSVTASLNQGGTAVGSANPLQVTLANTGANSTAIKVDGSSFTQKISGSVTAFGQSSSGAIYPLLVGEAYTNFQNSTGLGRVAVEPIDQYGNTLVEGACLKTLVTNSVTIGSLPAIAGTVTANLSATNLNAVTIGVRGPIGITDNNGSLTVDGSVSITNGNIQVSNFPPAQSVLGPYSQYFNLSCNIPLFNGIYAGAEPPVYFNTPSSDPQVQSSEVRYQQIVANLIYGVGLVFRRGTISNGDFSGMSFASSYLTGSRWVIYIEDQLLAISSDPNVVSIYDVEWVFGPNSAGYYNPALEWVSLTTVSPSSSIILNRPSVDTGLSQPLTNTQLRASAVTVSGTVTVGNSVTIGSLPVQLSTTTIGGTARLNVTLSSATTVGGAAPSYANLYGGSDGTNLRAILTDSSGRTVVTGSLTVTQSGSTTIGALPSGALTTRFGSVTTANLSQLTSCVTNSSRKYLLAQNISAGTVTIGIGFAPTTTQGIQLTAGAGITFDTFCPTGAVYWLGATTGATWTILEN